MHEMKWLQQRTSILAVLAGGLAVAACGESPSEPGSPVASVSVEPASVSFGALGSTVDLSATPRNADGAPVQGAVSWSTAGTGVVDVDPTSGLLTAVGNGTETVRADVGPVRGTLQVSVQQVPVSLALDVPTTSLSSIGQTMTLEPTAADSNGSAIAGPGSFTFSSSDPSVVHVSEHGTVTANWPGTADVEVQGGGFSESATFTVTLTGPAGSPVLGGEIPCSGGMARNFPCDAVDLLSYLPMSGLGGGSLNDMWGWRDPATSREFALLGREAGVTFVDVTDPLNPRPLGTLPSAGPPSTWRDVKVYEDHAYVVADGSPGHGVQVFDLTRLRDVEVFTTFAADARYTDVSSVHNIAINEETGYAYVVGSGGGGTTCGGGLHMLDLSAPEAPQFAGCFAEVGTGRAGTGYTHDVQCVVYSGPDAEHAGREICFASNETHVVVVDVTDKSAPVALSTATYPDSRYVHQGWLTEDQAHFVQNDELDELNGAVEKTRMLVWDVADLDDPVLVTEHFGPTGAIDHNMYVRGDRLFHSNYHFGLRVIDVADPAAPVEAGYLDTHPADDALGFDGSWSNFPWFAEDVVGVSSGSDGFFLVRARP